MIRDTSLRTGRLQVRSQQPSCCAARTCVGDESLHAESPGAARSVRAPLSSVTALIYSAG
jgi:hypothetical protein